VVLFNVALDFFQKKGCHQLLLSLSDEIPYISAFVVIE
jgi:phosphopantetheinyl transferase (holo-ACP synthase)